MRYADGRPLWQLSISLWKGPGQPVPVLRWSPNARRKIEAARDVIFRTIGTTEPLIEESNAVNFGDRAISVNWRKPLKLEEVNQMAPTPDVRERKGRP